MRGERVEMQRVCLDCAGVSGSHVLVPPRVPALPRVESFFRNRVPLGATGAQNDAPGP